MAPGGGEATKPPPLGFRPRDLIRLNPVPPGQHRVALRAGISVAVPLLTVIALGHPSWAAYAAFGSFTALYGRNHVHLPRAVMQATAGLALIAAVVLGTAVAASPGRPWTTVVIGALVAGGGSMLSTLLDWHPPGPIFVIFGFGTIAAGHYHWPDVPVALVVTTASVLFALVVGDIGAVARRTRRPMRPRLRRSRQWGPLRYVVAVGVAGAIATLSGIGHPWWAMVAAAAPLVAPRRDHQMLRAGHRIAGTTLGLLTATPLLILEMPPVVLVLVVAVLQFLTELLVGRNYALALLFITPMALLMGQLVPSQTPGALLADRWVETTIGAVVAIVLLLVEHRRVTR